MVTTAVATPASKGWRAIWRLLVLLRPHRRLLALTILWGTLAQGFALGAAAAAGWLVGRAVTGSPTSALVPGLVVLGGCAVGQGVAAWFEAWNSHDYAFRVIAALRTQLFDALELRAPAYLLGRRTGEVAAAVMSDVERLEWLYAHVVPSAAVAMIVPAGGLVGLAIIDPRLALAALPFAVLVASVPSWLGRRASVQGARLRDRLAQLHADVVEGVQGVRELILFGAGQAYRARLGRGMRDLLSAQVAYGRRAGLESGATDLFQASAVTAVVTLSAALVAAGALPPAAFPIAVVLTGAVFVPILLVTSTSSQIGELRGCAQRVLAILDAPVNVVERPAAVAPVRRLPPRVAFEAVSFGYGPADVLHQVSFSVEPGETVALIGHSGAGKSTCAALLMRFWDPRRGRITIAGHDLASLTLVAARDLVGYVPQDTYLFRASVRENLRLARPAATDEEIETAARLALADDFVRALPAGYHTVLDERGLSLSGGQRQRLAVARAFLKNAPVLVMDEAVANLDTENEQLLHLAVARLRQDRATLLIAHRLSTVAFADRVVVLDQGRVVETGTNSELLAAGGAYARLMSTQRERKD